MDSAICTKNQLFSPEFQMWARLCGLPGIMNRKAWEWAFISQALKEHGVLRPGKQGLGFAVGGEPLPAIYASFGASIIGTDLDTDEAKKKGWIGADVHAESKANLNAGGLCSPEVFDNLLQFEFCDMNKIPSKYYGKFDFVWSCCAMEHLGSLEHGYDFLKNSLKCLNRGGIAIHTTEYNVSSNTATVVSEGLSVFRRCDIEEIIADCRRQGYNITINWDCGTTFYDYHIDLPPYSQHPHLKLKILDFTVTCIGLVITKPLAPALLKHPQGRPAVQNPAAPTADAIVTRHTGGLKLQNPIAPMVAGVRTIVSIEVANNSKQVWRGNEAHPINLSYHWLKGSKVAVNDGFRTPLPPGGLEPGQSLPFEMLVEAPREAGKYTLVLTLVQEGICWFEKKGFVPAQVEVNVLPV